MAYVSMVRVRVKPEGRQAIEAGVAQLLAGRRPWQERGDLLESRVVRADAGQEYVLLSVWRDKAAHDGHEDAPEEEAALRGLAAVLAGPPDEMGGEVIAEL